MNQVPFKLVDQKIPFVERIALAVNSIGLAIGLIVTTLLLLPFHVLFIPINFIKILFTPTRKVMAYDTTYNSLPGPRSINPDDDEDWKRAHREEFGDE